jgi:uncharacterized protein YdaU (DUF1376 family)
MTLVSMPNAEIKLPVKPFKVNSHPQGEVIPFDISSYEKDTYGMSFAQHGAYLLAIIAYWKKGEALRWEELEEICGGHVGRICRFFHQEGGKWHHKRIDRDLMRAIVRNEKLRAKSAKGVEARRKLGQI